MASKLNTKYHKGQITTFVYDAAIYEHFIETLNILIIATISFVAPQHLSHNAAIYEDLIGTLNI